MWPDLFVDPTQPRRTASSLFEQLRTAIASGRLRAGDRVPPSRELAAQLGVARSTVAAVYGRLRAEGYLDGRTGDGTFVADVLPRSALPGVPAPTAVHDLLRPPSRTGRTPAPAALRADLRTGRPDPALFPLADWRRCVVDVLHAPPPGYGDPGGLPELRRTLAAWVARSRGVIATPEQVLVTAGAQQAFDVIARGLLAPGQRVAMEDPGYPPVRELLRHHGLHVVPVRVDDDGLVVDEVPRDVRAVYVTPSHQAPTGATMSAPRRRALLALAEEIDAVVVEDDYDTEYRYVDRPLEPLHRLDSAGRVLYVGTFSKTLSPSLRIGFLVAPAPVAAHLTDVRWVADSQPPHLTQSALAELIARGLFERHLRRTRRAYGPRRDLLLDGLGALAAEGLLARVWPAHAGLHVFVELADGHDASAVSAALAARGVAIPASDDWWGGPRRPALQLGFALSGPPLLELALTELRHVLRDG